MGDGPYAKRAAQEAGIRFSNITAPKLRRYTSVGNVFDVFKIPVALVQSLWKMFWFMPDVVFAKGGYTCAFPTLAARFFLIPVYLHESDSVPGLSNRMLAKRSSLVFTAFPSADEAFRQMNRPTMLVGNPIRTELAGIERTAAHQALQLDPTRKTIFITGGSQGAQQLNVIVLNGLVQMVQKGWNLVHQAGERNFADVQKTVQQYLAEGKESYAPLIGAQYRVYPFLDQGQMAIALAAADVVVSRAGAEALSEIAFLGKPCIVVPLVGSAGDHQVENARELAQYGAVVVDGANATAGIVMAQIEHLLDPQISAQVSQTIKQFAHADAADKIAQVLLRA